MKRDMKQWLAEWKASPVKKAFPVLSFPAVQLMGISVKELIADASAQARGMKIVAQRSDRKPDGSVCRGGMLRSGDTRIRG